MKSFNVKLFTGLLSILVVALCVGCSDDDEIKLHTLVMEGASSPEALRHPRFAGELVALRRSFFKDGGLDLALTPLTDTGPIELVSSGENTFGAVEVGEFVSAVEKGAPLVAVAARYLRSPVAYYSLNKSISSPKDMVGKRIGLQAGQDTEAIYLAMLHENQISRGLVKTVPVGWDFAPLLNREVDIWPGSAFVESISLKILRQRFNIIKPADHGVNHLGTIYFTTQKMVDKNPELVQAFVDGVIRGWSFTYSKIDDAASDVINYRQGNLDRKSVNQQIEAQYEYVKPEGFNFGKYTHELWEATISNLQRQGLIDEQFNYNDHVSFKFIDSLALPVAIDGLKGAE